MSLYLDFEDDLSFLSFCLEKIQSCSDFNLPIEKLASIIEYSKDINILSLTVKILKYHQFTSIIDQFAWLLKLIKIYENLSKCNSNQNIEQEKSILFKKHCVKDMIIELTSSKPSLQAVLTETVISDILSYIILNISPIDQNNKSANNQDILLKIRGKRSQSNNSIENNKILKTHDDSDTDNILQPRELYLLNNMNEMTSHHIRIFPSSMPSSFLDMLDLVARISCLNKRHVISVLTGTFLSHLESTHIIQSMDMYNNILPQKPIFDRDLYIEQLFIKNPLLLNILELISDVPPEFCRCFDIMKSLLACLIGSWNYEILEPSKSSWLNLTIHIFNLLQKVEWIPPKLNYCGDTFKYITSKDISKILMSLWSFIKDYPPRSNCYTVMDDEKVYKRNWPQNVNQDAYLSSFRMALMNNVEKLSSNHLYFYLTTT